MPHKPGEYEEKNVSQNVPRAQEERRGSMQQQGCGDWWDQPIQQVSTFFQSGSCEARPEKMKSDGTGPERRNSYSQDSVKNSVAASGMEKWRVPIPQQPHGTKPRGILQIADSPEQWTAVKHWGRHMGTDAIQQLYAVHKKTAASKMGGGSVDLRIYQSTASGTGIHSQPAVIDERMYQSASGIPKGAPANFANDGGYANQDPRMYSSSGMQQQQRRPSQNLYTSTGGAERGVYASSAGSQAAPAGLQDPSSTAGGVPRDLYGGADGSLSAGLQHRRPSVAGSHQSQRSYRAIQASESAYAQHTVPLAMPSKMVEMM